MMSMNDEVKAAAERLLKGSKVDELPDGSEIWKQPDADTLTVAEYVLAGQHQPTINERLLNVCVNLWPWVKQALDAQGSDGFIEAVRELRDAIAAARAEMASQPSVNASLLQAASDLVESCEDEFVYTYVEALRAEVIEARAEMAERALPVTEEWLRSTLRLTQAGDNLIYRYKDAGLFERAASFFVPVADNYSKTWLARIGLTDLIMETRGDVLDLLRVLGVKP